MTALTSLDLNEELQIEVRTITPLGKTTPTLKEFAIDLRHRIARRPIADATTLTC